MGTIKVKFKDGSYADIDEKYLDKAKQAGATVDTVSKPMSNNIKVRFKDGSEAQISSEFKDKAIAAGATLIDEEPPSKKKDFSLQSQISSVADLPTGNETSSPTSPSPSEPAKNKYQPLSSEEYNKQFEDNYGYRDFSLREPDKKEGLLTGSRYEQKKKQYEDIKSQKYKKIEQEEFNPVTQSILSSQVTPEELSNLYNKPYGKKVISDIINTQAPEHGSLNLGDEVYGNEKKWDQIAHAINVKNRFDAVDRQNQNLYKLDYDISKQLEEYDTETVWVSGGTGGGAGGTNKSSLPIIDTNNRTELSNVLQQIISSSELVNKDGTIAKGAKEKMVAAIQTKLAYLNAMEPLHPDLYKDRIRVRDAVKNVLIASGKGEDKEDAEKDMGSIGAKTESVLYGLNYIKDVSPGYYKNVMRTLYDKGQIADVDYSNLGRIGQQIRNIKVFNEGVSDPSKVGAETYDDFQTYQQKKSDYALAIGEHLKRSGFKNYRKYSASEIKKAASYLGLNNQEIVNDLIKDENILGYDAIPKTGGREAFVRGINQPFEGIRQTFNAFRIETGLGDVSEEYLKSKRLDIGIGGQQVSGNNGELMQKLPSDKGNIWYDALEGFGQFIPQVFLAKAIGKPIASLQKAITAEASTVAPLTAAQEASLINYAGTFTSVYLQEYGSSYMDALQKTGDYNKARIMGSLNGLAASAFELILPDTKIADRAAKLFKSGGFANDLYELIKKGGNIEELARKGKPFIERFVKSVLSTKEIAAKEISEELGTNIVNYFNEAIFSPQTASDRNLNNELFQTAKATGISMIIPSVLGGAGAMMNNHFTVNGLHSAAINFNEYKEALQKALLTENLTQEQYNQGIQMLSTHRESIRKAPYISSEGKILSNSERLEYAYQETLIKSYNNQLENAAGEVAKEDIQSKIKKAQDIQREILIPGSSKNQKPKVRTTGTVLTEDEWESRVMPKDQEDQLYEPQEEKLSPQDQTILDQLREIAAPEAKNADLQYFMDKASEAPTQFMDTYGVALTRRLLEKVDTETLKQRRDDLIQMDERMGFEPNENESIIYLNQIIKQQEEGKSQQSGNSESVSERNDIEAKKADIEKRREEELNQPFIERNGVKVFQKLENGKWISTGETNKSINEKYDAELAALEKQSTQETKSTVSEGKDIDDSEYNEFIDNGKVSDERLSDIANKVKNQQLLSDREKEIFTDKTSEINKIIASEQSPQGRPIEEQDQALTENEQSEWNSLSMQEKLALAKENLPDVISSMTDREVSDLADENAKRLLKKMQEQGGFVPADQIFNAIEEANKSKFRKKDKMAAIENAVRGYGEKGAQALEIHRNFDAIVKQLIKNNKLETKC